MLRSAAAERRRRRRSVERSHAARLRETERHSISAGGRARDRACDSSRGPVIIITNNINKIS